VLDAYGQFGQCASFYAQFYSRFIYNIKNTLTIKCIRDDTKAATGPSPHYIKKIKKYSEKRFSMWQMEFFHPAMWHMALG